jgi:excisionase family DNA binding protein
MSTIETEPLVLLTVGEAAELLRLAKPTVYRLIAEGALPSLKVGGSIRIDRAELLDALARHPVRVEEDTL